VNWKGELAQILTFAVGPAIGAFAAWWSVRSARVDGWTPRGFTQRAIAAWLATRLGTYIVVFHLFRYGGAWDMLNIWVPIAETVLAGGDASALVDNLYGPLYPYALAAGLFVGGGSGPATGLAFVLGDALALVLLHRIASRRLSVGDARRIVLFVLFSPLLWHGLIVRTQDEALFLFFLLLVQDALDRKSVRGAAIAAAAGALLTKALLPLYLFPILLAPAGSLGERTRRVVSAGAATALALGAALALGWDVGGREYANLTVRGSSSWLLFGIESTSSQTFALGLAATAIVCIAAAFAAWPRRPGEESGDRAARGVSAVQSAFFVLCPFSLPSHMAHGLAHVGWQIVRERKGWRTQSILVPFLTFQVVLTWLNPERWREFPWLIAFFVGWSAWVGFVAIRSPWSPLQRASDE